MSDKITKITKIIKIVLWLVPVMFLFWLFNQNFVPSGNLTVKCDADKCSSLVKAFATKEPDEIVGETKDKNRYRVIAHDPVYMTVKVPRLFTKATISAEFSNPDNLPVFNFGSLSSNKAYVIKNAFTYSSVINQLEKDWDEIKDDSMHLFIRPAESATHYSSISEFMNNLPELNKIRTFNIDLSQNIKLDGYRPSSDRIQINHALRGATTIVTYIHNEPLDFKLLIQDINRHKGGDSFNIEVWYGPTKVMDKKIKDDGVSNASGKFNKEKEVTLYLEKPLNGVYTININAKDDDIFIKNISTTQNLVMFKGKLYLADDDEYKDLGLSSKSTDLFTTGKDITVRVSHKNSLQTVKFDNKSLIIKNLNNDYILKRNADSSDIASINIPKSDIYLSTDGFFVFNKQQYFNDNLNTVSSLGSELTDNIQYIIAEYPKLTELENGWLKAQAEFSNQELYRDESGQYTFILQIPGLGNNMQLKLRNMEVKFVKEPITIYNIWSKLKGQYK